MAASEDGPILFVCGQPCSGKTTVGGILARMLGVPFLDLDDSVEELAGMPVHRVFAELGEERFRELEREGLLRRIAEGPPGVVSLGGGCLLDPRNLRDVLSAGRLVTLTAGTDVLLQRLAGQSGRRPLAPSGERFRELLARREPHYRSLPNRLDTSMLTPEEAASRALAVLEWPPQTSE